MGHKPLTFGAGSAGGQIVAFQVTIIEHLTLGNLSTGLTVVCCSAYLDWNVFKNKHYLVGLGLFNLANWLELPELPDQYILKFIRNKEAVKASKYKPLGILKSV